MIDETILNSGDKLITELPTQGRLMDEACCTTLDKIKTARKEDVMLARLCIFQSIEMRGKLIQSWIWLKQFLKHVFNK